MYTVTEIKTLYTFDELSDTAKDTAANNHIECSPWVLDDIVQEYISWNMHALRGVIVKNGKYENRLNYEYDMGCCQGSGFNFYGEFYLTDIFDLIGEDVPDDKREDAEGETVIFKSNSGHNGYTFSGWDNSLGYRDELEARIAEVFPDVLPAAAQDFAREFCDKMHEHCRAVYDDLWEYITEGVYIELDDEIHDGELYDAQGNFCGFIEDLKATEA